MACTAQQLLVIGVACWTFIACAPKMPQTIDKVRNYNATFLCGETEVVKVRFAPFSAALESHGVSVDLTQQPTADGFLYTGGGQSLRARGSEATWSDGNGASHQCRERAAESLKIDPPSR